MTASLILESLWNDYPWTFWIWAKKMPKNFSKSKLQSADWLNVRKIFVTTSFWFIFDIFWLDWRAKILDKMLTIKRKKNPMIREAMQLVY